MAPQSPRRLLLTTSSGARKRGLSRGGKRIDRRPVLSEAASWELRAGSRQTFLLQFAGILMELAGLEPAASWVRFGRAPPSNYADLQGLSAPIAQIRACRNVQPDQRECPPSSGDYREFAQNRAWGQAPRRLEAPRPAAETDLVAHRDILGVIPHGHGGSSPGPCTGNGVRCSSTRGALTPAPIASWTAPANRPEQAPPRPSLGRSHSGESGAWRLPRARWRRDRARLLSPRTLTALIAGVMSLLRLCAQPPNRRGRQVIALTSWPLSSGWSEVLGRPSSRAIGARAAVATLNEVRGPAQVVGSVVGPGWRRGQPEPYSMRPLFRKTSCPRSSSRSV